MISANGVEYKNLPEQVQYLTEQVADIWVAIENINPPDLTQYAKITYVDSADAALGLRIDAVEGSIGTLLTKTEAANTYAKIADIGTYINLSDYVKTTDMYTYVQAEIKNFDLDSNTDFTALKSRVSNLESSVSSMISDIADANTTAANAQTAAGNAVNTANNASAVATNAYNTATSAASDVAALQTSYTTLAEDVRVAKSNINTLFTNVGTAFSEIANIKNGTTHLFDNITDSHGNKRFVEFDGVLPSIEGLTITYAKCSLSGTHLMAVVAGNIANTTILTNGAVLCRFTIPTYISSKIHPVFSNAVETKVVTAYASDWTSQDVVTVLQTGTNVLSITKVGNLTLTADRNFRIQYDLLIDAS